MHRAEVGTTSTNNKSLHYSGATSLQAPFSSSSVGLVVLLELTTLAIDVLVVTHRVTAEVYSFLKDLLHRFEGESEIRLRYHLRLRARVYTCSPKYFV